MWNKLRNLISGEAPAETGDGAERTRAAAAVLMVEAALADGEFSADERDRIAALLADSFNLDPAEADDLLNEAERRADDAVDLFAQTRLLVGGLSEEDRLALVESLWRVIHADGVVHDYEAGLMRRVAGLLGLSDRDVALARQRALGGA